MRRWIMAAAVALLSAASALGQDMPRLTSAEILSRIVGNTVSGINTKSGAQFSEYYAPDGRILGDGGSGPIADGCWSVRGSQMCFSYGPRGRRNTYCWGVRASEKEALFITPDEGVEWVATIEPGNARNHTAPRRWVCERDSAKLDIMSPRTRVQ
jgi:hypothetical protein